MSIATDLKTSIDTEYRDYETPGVPASGEHKPHKPTLRSTFKTLVDLADAAGTTKVVAEVADLADLPDPEEGDRAEVRDDPLGDVPNGNGVWSYDEGTLAWVWVSDLWPQSAQDAIDAVEAAGIAALAALPSSKLVPVTITTPNANTWNCANVAPYAASTSTVVFGLAASSNTGAMTINIPTIGAKPFLMPNRDPIPSRHFNLNDPFAAVYVLALDAVILLWGGGAVTAHIATKANAGSTAGHLKADVAFAGSKIASPSDAALNAIQTFEVVASHDKAYGNVSVTVYATDGVTPVRTGVLRKSATDATVISDSGTYLAGDLLRIRWSNITGAPYLLPTANPALGKAIRVLGTVLDPPVLANASNPVQVRRVDDITWFFDVYPHDAHYTGAQKRNRGSDWVRYVLVNMGPFMTISVAPALNSYMAHYKRQTAPFCNLMYDEVPVGIAPETGVSPSTVEPIMYSKKVGTFTPGTGALACGLGHGGLIPESWKMTGTKSDPSTGNLPPFNSGVTAATRSNPLTVTIPGANYQVGRTFTLQGITGMVQLNGVPLTVSSVGPGDVYTINGIDSTAWGVFTGHTAGNYVEKDTLDLQALPIGVVYSGDKVISVFTGFIGTNTAPGFVAGNGEKAARFTYTLTFESVADYQCRVQVRYDPTDPGVNVQMATVDGNMAYLLPVRDADECAGFLGGVPVNAIASGTHVLTINQGDGAQRSIGKVDEVRSWWSGAKTSQLRVRNRSGAPDGGSATGYSHKENGVKIPRLGNTFVSTFVDYNKIYGDPIRVAAGDQDVHLIVFDYDFDITMISADPIV